MKLNSLPLLLFAVDIAISRKNLYWYSRTDKDNLVIEYGIDESRKENRILPIVLFPSKLISIFVSFDGEIFWTT